MKPQRRALVVGIERYPALTASPSTTGAAGHGAGDVPGAADDAVAFYTWLRDVEGLAEEEISLHLSPASHHPSAKEATFDALQQAVADLREQANRITRLYVFFSGHGFSFQSSNSGDLEDLIACADFKSVERTANLAVKIGDLCRYLRGMGPCEQYFFFDACRNSVASSPLFVGSLGLNAVLDPSISESSRFLLFSSRPDGMTRAPSPFTSVLLDGLQGKGTAKVWRGRKLLLTFESLKEYVADRMKALGHPAPFRDVWGSLPGVLRELDPQTRVECRIEVEGIAPGDLLLGTASVYEIATPPFDLPGGKGVCLVAPNSYLVTIGAQDGRYSIAPATVEADLYDNTHLQFSAQPLVPSSPVLPTPPGARAFALTAGDSPDDVLPPELVTLPLVERIDVRFSLPPGDVALELEDALGRPADVARPVDGGEASAGLHLGRYRATLREDGEVVSEQVITVLSGGPRRFDLTMPAGDSLRVGIAAARGGLECFTFADATPPVDQRLSAWLTALAADLAQGRSERLGTMPPLQLNPPAGLGALLCLFAADTLDPSLLLASASSPRGFVEARTCPKIPGLWVASTDLEPGSHVLGWAMDGERASTVIPVAEGRVTTLILVERSGEPRSQNVYLLPVASSLSGAEIRWMERAERAFAEGRTVTDPGVATSDPILQSLLVHARLREGRADDARALLGRLRAAWPDFPDAAVLEGLLATCTTGPLTLAGLPVFAEGLSLLEAAPAAWYPPLAEVAWRGPWTRWARWPDEVG
jgi:hypothetical protein